MQVRPLASMPSPPHRRFASATLRHPKRPSERSPGCGGVVGRDGAGGGGYRLDTKVVTNMAVKDLKPHGTIAAVRRHQRAGDPLCEQCRVAWRDYRRERRNGQREDAGVEGVPVSEVFELPSELEETRSNYRAVVAAMGSQSTPATALSSLSARREALYARLVVLEEQRMHRELIESINDGDLAAEAVRAAGGSPLDELIARRSATRKPMRAVSDVDDEEQVED